MTEFSVIFMLIISTTNRLTVTDSSVFWMLLTQYLVHSVLRYVNKISKVKVSVITITVDGTYDLET